MVGVVMTGSAAGVASALHVLASHGVSRSAKNIATRQVLAETQRFFGSFVTNFGWLRRIGLSERRSLFAIAQQEVLVAASFGSCFRGNSDRQARAWCKRVMTNFILMEMRHYRYAQMTPICEN